MLGAIAQMCCPPCASVKNKEWKVEVIDLLYKNLSLCRIYAWSITKRETGSVKWNLQKVGNEINEITY